MSLKTERIPDTELDHIRDTLTGVVSFASKTRGEMHQRFDTQDKRFDEQDKRFDEQDKRLSRIENSLVLQQETLSLILSKLK